MLEQFNSFKKRQPIYGLASNWETYSDGVVINITYPQLNLTKTPLVFTSLHGTSSIWTVTGATSIYNATKDGFAVYLKGISKDNLILYKSVLHYQLIPQ